MATLLKCMHYYGIELGSVKLNFVPHKEACRLESNRKTLVFSIPA